MAMGFIRRAVLRAALYVPPVALRTVQLGCGLSILSDLTGEVRECTGASMLPTLAPEGDFLLHLHLPFYRLISPLLRTNPPDLISLPNVGGPRGKLDPAMGTGLRLGDLVVAVSPRDHSRMICKRVLGLPGDTVLVDPRVDAPSNHAESWTGSSRHTSGESDEIDEGQKSALATPKPRYITVPRGHVWLGGDNLGNSTDSRTYGPVPLGLVQGVIVAKVRLSCPRLSSSLTLKVD